MQFVKQIFFVSTPCEFCFFFFLSRRKESSVGKLALIYTQFDFFPKRWSKFDSFFPQLFLLCVKLNKSVGLKKGGERETSFVFFFFT